MSERPVLVTPTPGGRPSPAAHRRSVCAEILRRGYRVGEQLLRPAEVVVSESPEE